MLTCIEQFKFIIAKGNQQIAFDVQLYNKAVITAGNICAQSMFDRFYRALEKFVYAR